MEVGCGSGLGSIFLGQHSKKVKGIDVKKIEIEEANSINKSENVSFDICDLFDMSPDEKFDVIVSLDVIEHMTVEVGEKLLKAKLKHLKQDGILIIGTPSIHSYPYQSPESQASHVNCYDLPDLLSLIDPLVKRTLSFSMNDEIVHTGHHKMAWYYFVIGFGVQ